MAQSRASATTFGDFLEAISGAGTLFVFDIYADIFSAMQIFGNGLLRLVICGTALPDSFFEILNGLPRLRYLNLRQCIVPAAPNRLATPPPLETLALVDLTPRCYGVYSAYFVHLFNGLTTISIDHGPHEHDFQQLSVPPLECEPVRITLGAAAEQVSCTHYTTALSHFRLHALEELVIIIPGLSCWPFACYDNFPLEDVPCLATMPRLRTLMAPPHIVELLARKTSQLQSVAVQGPGLARVFCVLGALERHGQSMQHLAINTRRWDDDLVPYISQRFPELQSLEILYHEDEPSERSLEVIGHNLRKLTKLNTLHIHRFPHGIYRPWKDHVDNYRQPSCQHRASNSIEPSTKLSDIGLVSTAVPTLVRVKLRHDFESGHGWARDNADSPWYESVYRVECTSAREIQEDMRTEYSPMGYYGALVLHHLAPLES
ncbi:F-box domain-containing protein [Mycena chlorophos]|uniref:F-box domain-containing protein n=1 Tax=Mycena chlorophos TaxID=658473 RepID=A0A8H6TSI1_MYCCL|nr:F-box domain-containing protein [Mycena chlorophos]